MAAEHASQHRAAGGEAANRQAPASVPDGFQNGNVSTGGLQSFADRWKVRAGHFDDLNVRRQDEAGQFGLLSLGSVRVPVSLGLHLVFSRIHPLKRTRPIGGCLLRGFPKGVS